MVKHRPPMVDEHGNLFVMETADGGTASNETTTVEDTPESLHTSNRTTDAAT